MTTHGHLGATAPPVGSGHLSFPNGMAREARTTGASPPEVPEQFGCGGTGTRADLAERALALAVGGDDGVVVPRRGRHPHDQTPRRLLKTVVCEALTDEPLGLRIFGKFVRGFRCLDARFLDEVAELPPPLV